MLFRRDARSALYKFVSATSERPLAEARTTAEKVRLLVQHAPDPDAEVTQTIWRPVRDNHVTRSTAQTGVSGSTPTRELALGGGVDC